LKRFKATSKGSLGFTLTPGIHLASSRCQIAPVVPNLLLLVNRVLQKIGGADMVIMREPFIVYHLFQNCQVILCGNLKVQGNFPLQEKYLAQVALVSVSWRHYYRSIKEIASP
jgi:hypothetical protein